jgi:Mg-chelatase subunit ChlD
MPPRALCAALALAACSHSGHGAGASTDDGGATDGARSDVPDFFPISGSGGAGGVSGGVTLPPGCADVSVQGERLPVDLYMMIDVSASMLQKTADGPTKWDAVRTALSSFFTEPQSTGIGVGLQFFPQIAPGSVRDCTSDAACGPHGPCFGIRTCSGLGYIEPCATAADCAAGSDCIPFGYCASTNDFCTPVGGPCAGGADTCAATVQGYCLGRDSCTAADYATPAVEVADLPTAGPALNAALTSRVPDGYTPTSAALTGAIEQVRALAAAHPDRRAAVVMATDGLPTSCQPKDIEAVAAIARQAHEATPAIPTFVIGVFGAQEQAAAGNLHLLAQSGGTGSARLVDANRNVTQAFLAALDDIRATAVSCEIKVPTMTAKGPVEYANVNVRFTAGNGTTVDIGYTGDRAGCRPGQQGWFYDVDPGKGTPTRILTCDATCDLLRSDPRGRVDIVIGCKTVLIK